MLVVGCWLTGSPTDWLLLGWPLVAFNRAGCSAAIAGGWKARHSFALLRFSSAEVSSEGNRETASSERWMESVAGLPAEAGEYNR